MNKKTAIIAILIPFVIISVLILSGQSSKNPIPGAETKNYAANASGSVPNVPQSSGSEAQQNTLGSSSVANQTTGENKGQKMQIDKTKQYFVTLKTTDGDIKIQLFADKTPITVNNFVTLTKSKFYDGTVFHRIIEGFMIQGGDPKGDGTGGPGYKFDDEPIVGEYTKGTVAMANAGPNTNGSQFFIMLADVQLQKNYVIFGKVVEGQDTVDKIGKEAVTTNSMGEKSKPMLPIKILTATVEEK
jgi:peptidylprolyl isomerase